MSDDTFKLTRRRLLAALPALPTAAMAASAAPAPAAPAGGAFAGLLALAGSAVVFRYQGY